ncbi:MAG TPA: aldo/keto reductase, partial [Verrucomicrobiae bacterium]|nr:aldo/keto reductase [Verrucomicrobiae bacterium]
SFEKAVLPELNKRGIAPIAMKSLSGNAEPVKRGVISAAEAIRYVLSLPISVLVSGIDSIKMLRENLKTASRFQPMSADEMQALRERVREVSADGRFELFKTSKYYDGPPGRHQHGFPGLEELES